jgi:hypothetical protein
MIWLKQLMDKCIPLKIEIIKTPVDEILLSSATFKGRAIEMSPGESKIKLVFVCAKAPDRRTRTLLLNLVPNDITCEFIEALKGSTAMELGFKIQASGGAVIKFVPKDHHIEMTVNGPQLPELDDPLWADVQEILKKDGYAQSWEIAINGDKIVYDEKMATEMASHKIRDREFTDEDMTDLKIMVETSGDVNDFLAMLEGKRGEL